MEKRPFFPKSTLYNVSDTFITKPAVFISEGDDHWRRRKLVEPAFSRKYIETYAEIMVENAVALQDRRSAGQVIDADQIDASYREERRFWSLFRA